MNPCSGWVYYYDDGTSTVLGNVDFTKTVYTADLTGPLLGFNCVSGEFNNDEMFSGCNPIQDSDAWYQFNKTPASFSTMCSGTTAVIKSFGTNNIWPTTGGEVFAFINVLFEGNAIPQPPWLSLDQATKSFVLTRPIDSS